MRRRFKSDRDETWQDCSSSKYASPDGVGFPIRRHNFKMAAMTSFHAEKCCHLVSEHEASDQRQFLIGSTFVYTCYFITRHYVARKSEARSGRHLAQGLHL